LTFLSPFRRAYRPTDHYAMLYPVLAIRAAAW
jgi:hypothetical protein